MPDLLSLLTSLAWPLAIALAWLAGEFGQRWTGLPRISFYGLVGFALGSTQIGALPAPDMGPVSLLANVAFGLILFELGNRINLRWLVNNPWIGVAGLVEAALTFILVYFVASAFGVGRLTALLMAALSMATSPATVVRVVNEQKSSGQMTERVLHLSAQNCVLAVFVFNVTVGFGVFQTSGDVVHASWTGLVVLAASSGLGAAQGIATFTGEQGSGVVGHGQARRQAGQSMVPDGPARGRAGLVAVGAVDRAGADDQQAHVVAVARTPLQRGAVTQQEQPEGVALAEQGAFDLLGVVGEELAYMRGAGAEQRDGRLPLRVAAQAELVLPGLLLDAEIGSLARARGEAAGHRVGAERQVALACAGGKQEAERQQAGEQAHGVSARWPGGSVGRGREEVV